MTTTAEADGLVVAHAAVKARSGHAPAEVLAAIKAVAQGGTVEQFVDADQKARFNWANALFTPTVDN